MSTGLTKMWRIAEKPGWEVEQTPGAWALWGPCCRNRHCAECGGENTKVVESCGQTATGAPADPDMVKRATGLATWTPERIQ